MEYLAKKSFSFLQDSAFTSINSESYTNKWNMLQKSRFLFCKILRLLAYDFYILYVFFDIYVIFIFTGKVFYQKFIY